MHLLYAEATTLHELTHYVADADALSCHGMEARLLCRLP